MSDVRRTAALALGLLWIASVMLGGCRTGPRVGGETLAIVNEETITRTDLDVRLKIMELFFRQKLDDPASKQKVLDSMVQDLLIRSQAASFQVTVTDADVEAEMARFFGALDQQYENREAVNAKLQELGLTNEHLAGFLRNFLIAQGVVEAVKGQATVTDEEVRTFYEQNRQELYTFDEEAVRAAHILIPTDQEETARQVVSKARSGGDFAELARLYSVDPGSRQMGGELGYFTRDAMVEEFADAAFALEPGQISDPVRSRFGWHVIRVIDRVGPGTLPLEKARPDVINRLLPEKQEQVFRQWLRDLEQSARIEKASFVSGEGQR